MFEVDLICVLIALGFVIHVVTSFVFTKKEIEELETRNEMYKTVIEVLKEYREKRLN